MRNSIHELLESDSSLRMRALVRMDDFGDSFELSPIKEVIKIQTIV